MVAPKSNAGSSNSNSSKTPAACSPLARASQARVGTARPAPVMPVAEIDPVVRGRKALEVEFLELLIRYGRPVQPKEIFGEIVPTWVGGAAERCQTEGYALRDQAGFYTVTEFGRAFVGDELAKAIAKAKALAKQK